MSSNVHAVGFCVVPDGKSEDALSSKVWACISSTTCCALFMSRGVIAEVHELPVARAQADPGIRLVMACHACLNLLAWVRGFQCRSGVDVSGVT